MPETVEPRSSDVRALVIVPLIAAFLVLGLGIYRMNEAIGGIPFEGLRDYITVTILSAPVAIALLYVVSAVGLYSARAWSWPLLAGVAGYALYLQVFQLIPMLGAIDDVGVGDLLDVYAQPFVLAAVNGGTLVVALLPSVRDVCAPAPAAA